MYGSKLFDVYAQTVRMLADGTTRRLAYPLKEKKNYFKSDLNGF